MQGGGFCARVWVWLIVWVPLGCLALSGPYETEPSAAFAHGEFFWDAAISEPDEDYVLSVQKHFIRKFEGQVEAYPEQRDRITRLIYSRVSDKVLANGVYLDWLRKNLGRKVHPSDVVTLNTIRWYYTQHIQNNPADGEANGYWTKGLAVDVMQGLQHEGLDIFVPVPTSNAEYVKRCRAEEVPIPTQLFDNQWQSAGVLDELLNGGSKPHNELSVFVSHDPPGFCLALNRSGEPGSAEDDRGHIDLICVGQQSSKACFFETEGFNNPVGGVVSLSELSSADQLPFGDMGSAAPCTRCHVGDNPFLIHPKDTAFEKALELKSSAIGSGGSWNTENYYEPVSVASWPENPPPLDLKLVPSEKSCSGCHVQGFAGRFPDIAGMPDPTLYDLYCARIMARVLSGGPDFSPTMPMNDMDDTAMYVAHKTYLRAMCREPDVGEVVGNTFEDDSSHLSPPRIIAPYECATSVYVEDFIDAANIEVLVNGVSVKTINGVRLPGPVEIPLPVPLESGDTVQTRQSLNGIASGLSQASVAADYKALFPDGLPAPSIDPDTIYACAGVVAVRYEIAGFELELLVNGGDPVISTTFAGHQGLVPGKTPFELNDEFSARVRACNESSPVSSVVKAQRSSSGTLTAAEINPDSLFEGQTLINALNLTHGSRARVEGLAAVPLAMFSTPLSWGYARLGRALAPAEQLVVSQRLCAFTNQPDIALAPAVQPCSSLPAPEIHDPLPGEQYVRLVQPLLGARVRIHDSNGQELGDGTGAVVRLNRPLQAGEFINAVQQIGECVSSSSFRIRV